MPVHLRETVYQCTVNNIILCPTLASFPVTIIAGESPVEERGLSVRGNVSGIIGDLKTCYTKSAILAAI
jgi:hypothetical protein